MKLKSIILFIWGFLAAGAALAQGQTYVNFRVQTDFFGNPLNDGVWIVFEHQNCKNVNRVSEAYQSNFSELKYFDCVQPNLFETPLWNNIPVDGLQIGEVINSFFKNHDDYKKVSFNTTLVTGSITDEFEEIDFKQVKIKTLFNGSKDTSCVANHTPIRLGSKVKEVDGRHKVFKNLCFAHDVSGKDEVNSIGFFEDFDSLFVRNFNFNNVYFSVKKSSGFTKGRDYPPVGVVAGVIKNSTIDSITLTDVAVSSPIAGGVAGVIVNSAVSRIIGDDDVYVKNTLDMSNEKMTSFSWFKNPLIGLNEIYSGKYNVYLGGVAGVSYDMAMNDVDLISKVYELASSKESALGGLVGGYVLSQNEDGSSPEIVLNDLVLPRKTSLNNNNVYTKVSGGKIMGGIIGDLSVYGYTTGGTRDLSIKNSSFQGRILDIGLGEKSSGGFIGRAVDMNRGALKIDHCQSELVLKDTLQNENIARYHIGGFIGDAMFVLGGSKTENRNDLYVSIKNSKSTGEIVLEEASESRVKAFVGGLVGEGAFTFDSTAMVEDTSSISINLKVGSLNDTLMVGGFVGKMANYNPKGDKEDIIIDKSVFNGSITLSSSKNDVFVGGFIGQNQSQGSYRTIISRSTVENDSLLINVGEAGFGMVGYKHVGGLCGLCGALTNIENVSVVGDIKVIGTSSNEVNVGGFGGTLSIQATQDFEVSGAFFKGDIEVPQTNTSVKAGYMFGFADVLNPGKSSFVHRKFLSTYHVGPDTFDAFGLLGGLSNPHGTDWKMVKNVCEDGSLSQKGSSICWDVRYNVRNGNSENLTSTNNGTMVEADMKHEAFANFLNEPYSDTVWAWKVNENEKYPYLLMNIPALKPLPPNSSSSEASSSSIPVPETSSSAEANSSNPIAPETSSSSEASSSSIPVPETSSSAEANSSNPIVPETSSSFEQGSCSSSEKVVAKFAMPEIISRKVESSGLFTKFTFGIKAGSTDGKVEASLRVRKNGKVIYDNVVVDSVAVSMDNISVSLVSLPAGKLSYEFSLACGSAKVKAEGEFIAETPNGEDADNAWQMVSISNLDFESLVLDDHNALYWWNETEKFGDYWQYCVYALNDDSPGTRGYWFGTFNNTELKYQPSTYDENAEIIWNLDSVYSGWNLVANPYGWNVDISELAESFEVWNWNAGKGKYEQNYTLKPYEAVWVKTSSSVNVRIPASAKPASGNVLARKSGLARTGDGWTIRATLFDEFGKDDSWNMFGVNRTVYESEEPPEGMGDYVSLSFMEGNRALAKSFKPASEEMEWSARLRASGKRDAFLKLDGVESVLASGKKVFVTIDGKTVEMKDGKSIRVEVGRSAKIATIRVATEPRAELEYALTGVRVIHSGNNVNVHFSASDGLAGSLAKVELIGVDGKVAVSTSLNPNVGSNVVSMFAPKQGLYILRVRAGNQVSASRILLK